MSGLADGAPHELGAPARGTMSVVLPAEQPDVLSPELDDLITEAVALPATAAARAEVVSALSLRALDAVAWRSGLLGNRAEESSLLGVVTAAEAHRRRMAGAPERVH